MNSNRTVDNFEPDNELFRYIMLSALCLILSLYYAMVKAFNTPHLAWYDWLFLATTAAAATYFFLKTYRHRY